jgi:thiamine pyrophosphokinase
MASEWNPTQFFSKSSDPNEVIAPFALLVLNQPINERAFSVLKRNGMCLNTVQLLDTPVRQSHNRTG